MIPSLNPTAQERPTHNTYIAHLQRKQLSKAISDEYELYLSTPHIRSNLTCNLRKWWLGDLQRRKGGGHIRANPS